MCRRYTREFFSKRQGLPFSCENRCPRRTRPWPTDFSPPLLEQPSCETAPNSANRTCATRDEPSCLRKPARSPAKSSQFSQPHAPLLPLYPARDDMENQMRAIADMQSSLHVDSSFRQSLNFIHQRRGIHHHSRPDHRLPPRPQNPTRNQLQHIAVLANNHRMPGIVPTGDARKCSQTARPNSRQPRPLPSSPHCAPTTTTEFIATFPPRKSTWQN